MRFDKLLLSELRVIERKGAAKADFKKSIKDLVASDIANATDICNENKPEVMSAIVDNENLKALGYTLSEEGLFRLVADYKENPRMKPLYKRVQELEPSIEVSPMYPNFPIQVLEMDALEYRVHQLLHYISTYGVESAFGVEVQRGWLPETEEVMEREIDTRVVKAKMVDYLSPEEVDRKVISSLLERKQRLEPLELEIARAVALRTNEEINEIPFKENIVNLFAQPLLESEASEREAMLSALAKVMKHPGDMLDFLEELVVLNKYKHFPTSLKRGLVEILERFSPESLEENLASNRWSNRFRGKNGKARSVNRNIALIDYLSFNRFSKNPDSRRVVEALKNGELVSWNQKLEAAYAAEDFEEVVRLLRQRPGMFFRQVNRLMKRGLMREVISRELVPHAGDLKTQTIVSALNNFTGEIMVDKVFFDVLIANLRAKKVDAIADKKVFIDDHDVDFSRSRLEITERAQDGGYLQPGLAIRIPEEVKYLRFFTYWNDKKRIDIDLHAAFATKEGRVGHIGFYSAYKNSGLVHSGDITHSNAAEYVDIDFETALKDEVSRVQFNLNCFNSVPFSNIETVFTGLMALSEMGLKTELYDSKNVFFRHDLESKATNIDYGFVDLENRVLYLSGKTSNTRNDRNLFEVPNYKLTIEAYLRLLLATQGAEIVDNKEDADVVLGLAKSDEEKYLSLIDENFFMA